MIILIKMRADIRQKLNSAENNKNDDDVIKQIKEVLDSKIRPP